MNKRILIVDDDKYICELLRIYLEKENYEISVVYDGIQAVKAFENGGFSLVLLDIMLPEIGGWDVCREIRKQSACPIIMISAKGEVFDKVLGLELGADDYIVKPFDMKEVIARINAVMRRYYRGNNQNQANTFEIKYENLYVNIEKYEMKVNNKLVETPPKELELIYCLAKNPNKVFARNELLKEIWGYEFFGDSKTVDVHISRLREKLKNASDKWELKTVWGIGYKFELKDEALR